MNQLKLNDEETKYLKILVLSDNAKSEDEKNIYLEILSDMRPEQNTVQLADDQFRVISEWYHLPILEMTQLTDFQNNAEFIADNSYQEKMKRQNSQ